MTDPQEDSLVLGSKRRRLGKACDICKRRKIRCDSAQMPGNRCSNCIAFNSLCTHASKALKTSDSPPLGTSVFRKTAPDHVACIIEEATGYIPDDDLRRVLLDVARYARNLENQLASLNSKVILNEPGPPPSPPPPRCKEDDEEFYILTDRFERFRLETDSQRYFGKASHFELLDTAIGVTNIIAEECTLQKTVHPPTKRPQFWLSSWEKEHHTAVAMRPPLVFPDLDLLHALVSLYFTKVDIIINLLHRPTFEKTLASGLHLIDHLFGSVVLGVCAMAAKYSDDPRVILPGTETQLSSGWEYFRQLDPLRKSPMHPFTLYEAQTLCLYILYLQSSSAPIGCWEIAGAGIRYAQEVGAHRRKRFQDKMESEHWKRVFWLLVSIDTVTSSFCGRPRATNSSDYDLDYPEECDDEYWEPEDPALAFKQPANKPSALAFRTAYLKLIEIIGIGQQTLWLVNRKDKSEKWTKDVMASLDSALNSWIDSVPLHLRWGAHIEDPVFATQSAVLYTCYYHAQIQIHRISIISAYRQCGEPPFNYPSLAICASSARACCHVMDVASQRGFLCNPHVLNAVFDSCVVLLLNAWGGRRIGIAVDPKKCMQDVEMCRRIFRTYEIKWPIAGRLHDIITELMNATNMGYISSPPNPLKRRLDSESSDADTGSTASAGNGGQTEALVASGPLDAYFALPMYTEDLGRLPLFEPLTGTDDWVQGNLDFNSSHDDFRVDLGSDDNVPAEIQSNFGPAQVVSLIPNALAEPPTGDSWEDWTKYINGVGDIGDFWSEPDNPAS
ncbi:fungal-specific transcription factor domain-containing protein [Roridomyces roridus]|uniref:Fungal-specific transcription factor domain-containing protein n=1 Tax=Roridomyces roridus TaxID=1738132 RepID=A0AAD7CGM2_9AGAR|nr:fungal-specific transcription factor domain-containing protein [Roridomyces roridus]